MTYEDVIKMKANLDKVNFIEGANARFVYAVAKNKAKLESIIRVMQKMIEPSEQIKKFQIELDKLNQKYAERDADGTIGYVNINGASTRAYRKIVGDGNPGSDFGKELTELKKKFAEEIKEHEAKIKAYNDLLSTELPAGEYRKHMIDLEIVPAGLHPAAMSGCLEFIKENDDEANNL